MNPFRYERAADAAGAVATLAAAPAGAYLGGGTNLVDLMKLGVERPSCWSMWPGCRTTASSDTRGRRRAHRRGGAEQRRSPPTARSIALPGARAGTPRRRVAASCATSRRPAATCCSARAASIFRTWPSRATSASPAAAARRATASIATSRSSARVGPCIATHPSDMAVALAALDAIVHVKASAGARDPARRFPPPAGRDAPARHRARPRRPDHGGRAPGQLGSPRVRLPARCATERRTRSRWSRSPSRSTWRTASFATPASRSAAWRTNHGERRAPRTRCAADPRTPRRSAGRRMPSSPKRSRSIENAYKVPLARNVIVRTLLDLAEKR